MKCRFCKNELKNVFLDLNHTPVSNDFISIEKINEPEIFYPLKTFVCDKCFLVQLDEYKFAKDIFNKDYAYFSSYSKSWLEHSKNYVNMISDKLNLNSNSFIVEIASNDGYLLQYFKEKKIPCLGIEPTANTAEECMKKDIDVIQDFFGIKLAKKLQQNNKKADLIIGNNVLAHVPDLNDFVKGLKILVKPQGTITLEFPHLMQLVKFNQFDTIYHEHFSYFSFCVVKKIFDFHGLEIFNVEKLSTHGGSLRIYVKLKDDKSKTISNSVFELEEEEKKNQNMLSLNYYQSFQPKVDNLKNEILSFLLKAKEENKTVIAYGAAAKGNTLLNYCGIKKDLISFVVDRSPHKQNKFLPGSRIPVVDEEKIKKIKPDYVIILPWNLKEEIMNQLSYIKKWDGKFVFFIPSLQKL
ncbi:MAG: methyltransferase domain-containing protein [Parachlamydiales bacterium]|nr:methyltransferase domain-containing protein [Parachlamydiales bacterium]